MKKSELKKLIKDILKEQGPVTTTAVTQVGTPSGNLPSYTAVVDSGGQRVNIRCPQGAVLRSVGGITNSLAGRSFNMPAQTPVTVECISRTAP